MQVIRIEDLPGVAPIDGLVDAGGVEVSKIEQAAGACIHDVRIGGVQRQRAHRDRGQGVRLGVPGRAAVGGLPQPASVGGDVQGGVRRAARVDRDVGHQPRQGAAWSADLPLAEIAKRGRSDGSPHRSEQPHGTGISWHRRLRGRADARRNGHAACMCHPLQPEIVSHGA